MSSRKISKSSSFWRKSIITLNVVWPSSNDIMTSVVCVNRVLNSKWKSSRVSCTWNACKWIECTSFLVELPPPALRSFRVLLEKRKFLVETGPEREESFIKYSSTGTANRSPNFFHRIPSNHCETSSKLPCPNTVHIISHRSMLISSRETKRNSRFFEFIFHCRIEF